MIDNNTKTFKSIDFSTVCPKLKKGTPCEYCYVNINRQSNTWVKKKIVFMREYTDQVINLPEKSIERLNSMGGLRIFSFSDYEPWMDENLRRLIGEAKSRNLKLKAITKQKEFIDKYKDDVFINISIDNVYPKPVWVWGYKHKNVKIRMMIRNGEEAEKWAQDSRISVLTPYHGKKINNNYRPKEAMEACIKLAPEKTCCKTHKCETCDVKCGV